MAGTGIAERGSKAPVPAPATRGPRTGPRRRRGWGPVLAQGPSLLVLGLVILFPLAYSINLSFRSYSLVIPDHTGQWVGLENYSRMLHDGDWYQALLVTAIFTVCAVTIETVLGVAVGVFIDRLRRTRRIAVSLLLLPMILTPLVVGLMFNFALNSQFGYLTWFFKTIGFSAGVGVLNTGPGALTALILIDVWEWFPFVALMVVAGLQTLPKEPFEAASIDGASGRQSFRYLTLPMLAPILGVAVLFRTTEAIREFDKVYVLTGGGPGSATTVNDLYQYRVSFQNWDLSYGATLGLVSFAFVLLLSGILYRRLNRKEVQR
ncbi:MAG TPA: sugar ABC transporter permease [Candidatus Nanopelagicales bacterium]|nr:sugar ABC transporter permease [Candidatus Nanopelagicales bacterium]